MARKGEDQEKRERVYTGPICQAMNDSVNADGSRTCNLPAHRTINGMLLCDGHAAIEALKAAQVREVQAKAREWCAERGLDSPDNVRMHAGPLAKQIFTRSSSKEWAGDLLRRIEDGAAVSHYAQKIATEVASKP